MQLNEPLFSNDVGVEWIQCGVPVINSLENKAG